MAENGPFHEVEELLSGDLALCPTVADASALTLEPAPASQPRPLSGQCKKKVVPRTSGFVMLVCFVCKL